MTTVLLHPVGLDGACWSWIGLPDAARPTLVEDDPPGDLTLELIADRIAGAHDGPLDLVGVSMGGMVAQHVAIRHPSRVRSMLLACTSGNVAPGFAQRLATEAEARGVRELAPAMLERWFTPNALRSRPPGVIYTEARLRSMTPSAFAAGWRAMARHDLLDALATVDIPVTCLAAEQDAAAPRAALEALHESLPTSRLLVEPGPHMLHLERPEAFTLAVTDHQAWALAVDRGDRT